MDNPTLTLEEEILELVSEMIAKHKYTSQDKLFDILKELKTEKANSKHDVHVEQISGL